MIRLHAVLTLIIALGFLFVACESNVIEPDEHTTVPGEATAQEESERTVVHVTAHHPTPDADHYEFALTDEDGHSLDEIPSGWTTFEFINESGPTHYGTLMKLPVDAIPDGENVNVNDPESLRDFWIKEIINPWQEPWFDYFEAQGEMELDEFLGAALGGFPDWYLAEDVVAPRSGGPGFTQGDITSKTTVYLEEGMYLIECFIMDDEGRFHAVDHEADGLGPMAEVFAVTDENSKAEAPNPTLGVSVSTAGIEMEEKPGVGQHIFEVNIEDQTVYENFIGHDLHLIRLDTGSPGSGATSVAEVGKWMNWLDVENKGTVSTSADPGPSTFLGGVQTIDSAPATAYLHVDLEPGRYAWVAEVPDPHTRQMMKVFNVPQGKAVGR